MGSSGELVYTRISEERDIHSYFQFAAGGRDDQRLMDSATATRTWANGDMRQYHD